MFHGKCNRRALMDTRSATERALRRAASGSTWRLWTACAVAGVRRNDLVARVGRGGPAALWAAGPIHGSGQGEPCTVVVTAGVSVRRRSDDAAPVLCRDCGADVERCAAARHHV